MTYHPPHYRAWQLAGLFIALLSVLGAPRWSRAAEASKPAPVSATSQPAAASTTAPSEPADADKAWADFRKAALPPMPPAEWRTQKPTPEEEKAFHEQQRKLIQVAIEKARDFQKRYSNDPRIAQAKEKEDGLVKALAVMEQRSATPAGNGLASSPVNNKAAEEWTRFAKRVSEIRATAESALTNSGNDAFLAAWEKGARALNKEFPGRPEPFQILLEVASASPKEKSNALLKEIAEAAESGPMGVQARSMLARLELLKKPLDFKFTAVDGRAVDMTKLRGKVVLVDFWATWCAPCIAALPHVKTAYDKFHAKGFEIVGISLDQDKDTLLKFVQKQGMAWPQFFDGLGWGNEFAQKFGITGIPAVWLVDKKGIVRDAEARGDLAARVEKLLAE